MNERRHFLQNPKIQTMLVVLIALLFYLYLTFRAGQLPRFLDFLKTVFYTATFNLGRVPVNVQLVTLDGVLLIGGLILWLAFFAQFVLPVHSVQDRYAALDRLFVYFIGAHGPAIFIEDGEVRSRRSEADRRGPGLIFLDSASAAVLRNDVSFTRPVGPGVVFTPKNEYLAQTVDLHIQARPRPPLGPLPDEDPFAPRADVEDDEMYAQRQERRMQTSGLTRDGVEVVPNILVIYQLERQPGDTRLGFGYNPDSVLRYVTSEGVNRAASRGNGKGQIPLNLLPAFLAVDLWREYLQKFTFNELFSLPSEPDQPGSQGSDTAFSRIRRMIQQRLTGLLVEDLDGVGQFTGGASRSREYEILKGAGIQALGVSISNLRLVRSVESTMLQQWIATWMQRAQVERELVESRRSQVSLLGKEEALLRFSRAAVRRIDEDLLALPRPQNPHDELAQMQMALERIVRGTLADIVSDPLLYQRLTVEATYLSDLIDWIRVQRL